MTLTKYLRQEGINGTYEVWKNTGKSRQTQDLWYKKQRKLFDCIIDGIKHRQTKASLSRAPHKRMIL